MVTEVATETARGTGRPGAVVARAVAVVDLALLGPAHFGGGEGDATDATVLVDGNGEPFIPGSTLAGALRSHLRWLLLPSGASKEQRSEVERTLEALFGAAVGPTEGDQSALIVDDAYPAPGSARPSIEQRDSVAIDPKTRTAREQAKFDYEALVRGATFRARLELEVRDRWDGPLLRDAFALLLRELQDGRVRCGAKVGSGFGRLQGTLVGLRDQSLLDWLRAEDPTTVDQSWAALVALDPLARDARLRPRYRQASLAVGFRLRGPLLIRAAPGEADAPDVVQLRSGGQAVASGTSLRGILRATASRVAATLAHHLQPASREAADQAASKLVQEVFGPEHELVSNNRAKPWAGRISVAETLLDETDGYEQTRNRIDRVTQGVLDGYLFTERPEYPRPATAGATPKPNLRLAVELRDWQDEHLGLLLQAVKDLWLGDVAVGGGANVGRGALRGLEATLELADDGAPSQTLSWRSAAPPGQEHDPEQRARIAIENDAVEALGRFQQALVRRLRGGQP
ncbi:MAG: hypothetical protein HY690_04350 [Chloroflexi bacterium]|nr:hypothetical protein [Chloroflexota bacterium]